MLKVVEEKLATELLDVSFKNEQRLSNPRRQ